MATKLDTFSRFCVTREQKQNNSRFYLCLGDLYATKYAPKKLRILLCIVKTKKKQLCFQSRAQTTRDAIDYCSIIYTTASLYCSNNFFINRSRYPLTVTHNYNRCR